MRTAAPFWQGVLAGIVITLAFVAGALGHAARRGLTLSLDSRALAAQVHAQVRDHVERQLPDALARARKELPPVVVEHLVGPIRGGRVQLGPVEVEVPDSVSRELELRLERAVSAAADRMLEQVDTRQVADRIGREAGVLVRERLDRVVAQWRPALHPLPWITIPVHLSSD